MIGRLMEFVLLLTEEIRSKQKKQTSIFGLSISCSNEDLEKKSEEKIH